LHILRTKTGGTTEIYGLHDEDSARMIEICEYKSSNKKRRCLFRLLMLNVGIDDNRYIQNILLQNIFNDINDMFND